MAYIPNGLTQDGTTVGLEDKTTPSVGSSSGTLLFGVDGDNKSRAVKLRNGGLYVASPEMASILIQILRQLELMNMTLGEMSDTDIDELDTLVR